MKLDPQAGRVVGHLDASAMKLGNSCNEAETKTIAGAVAAALEAIKPSEDVLALVNRNSRSAVGDRKKGPISALRNRHRNPAFTTAVLDRVVDKIGERVEQQIPIADYAHTISAPKCELYVALLRH